MILVKSSKHFSLTRLTIFKKTDWVRHFNNKFDGFIFVVAIDGFKMGTVLAHDIGEQLETYFPDSNANSKNNKLST